MLDYMVTISISGSFVPHYLSVFWSPLRARPWDVIAGGALVAIRVTLNVLGIREAVKLNITLAVLDFSTRSCCGHHRRCPDLPSPHPRLPNVHWGVAPSARSPT